VSLGLWWVVAGPQTFYHDESDAERFRRKLSLALDNPTIVKTCTDVCLLCAWADKGGVRKEMWVAILDILENLLKENEELGEVRSEIERRIASTRQVA